MNSSSFISNTMECIMALLICRITNRYMVNSDGIKINWFIASMLVEGHILMQCLCQKTVSIGKYVFRRIDNRLTYCNLDYHISDESIAVNQESTEIDWNK